MADMLIGFTTLDGAIHHGITRPATALGAQLASVTIRSSQQYELALCVHAADGTICDQLDFSSCQDVCTVHSRWHPKVSRNTSPSVSAYLRRFGCTVGILTKQSTLGLSAHLDEERLVLVSLVSLDLHYAIGLSLKGKVPPERLL